MFKEFKKFAALGNVLDLAVGIIIGGAFGKIVTSLVNDILMPPLGKVLGGIDFRDLFLPLSTESFATIDKAREAGIPILAYGNFIQSIVDFLIVTFSIFILIKAINKINKKKEEAAGPSEEVLLLREIRDSLKKNS